MEFIENKGQWHENVKYRGDFNTGSFFLENNGFTVLLNKPEDVEALSEFNHGHSQQKHSEIKNIKNDDVNSSFRLFHSFAYNVKFLGASEKVLPLPEKPLSTYNNYFIGSNKGKWASQCKIFQAITYKSIYPNIDIRYYSNGGNLKYDLIIYPGGNPSEIAMLYEGPELSIKNKELNIKTTVGTVKELTPYSYQAVSNSRNSIDCKFVVKNNIVSFDIKDYDPGAVLIIDPAIIFSTFTGSPVDNWGYTATPGPDGSFYAGGIAFGQGYPVSTGAYQTTFGNGDYDIAIFKFSVDGSKRDYATYLGGGNMEQPHSMIVDPQGNLILAGRTNSDNFPIKIPRIGTAKGANDYDIIISKFNSTGTDLIGSIKIGGSGDDGVNIRDKAVAPYGTQSIRRNYGDDARSEVVLDPSGNVFLASCTQSPDFFTTVGGGYAGNQDGVILKFAPDLSSLSFSMLFGGRGDDACFVGAVNGDLYIGGSTTSDNLPGNKTGVISPGFNGVTDGFVTVIKPDGSGIIKTTYLGTSGADMLYGLKFDRNGFPYVMGTTTGTWPVQNAAFSNTRGKQFISKLRPDLSGYIYSTVFGTDVPEPNISPIAFLVDRCENVYVSGWGGGINNGSNGTNKYSSGTTANLPEVNPLSGIPPADGQDFYFFVLKKDAQSQLFGSHFGQNGGMNGDHVDGGTSRFDENGIIYQAMCANCGGGAVFPTTSGSWASNNGSNRCNEAAVKISLNFAGVGAGLQSSINGSKNDTLGCLPLTVNFLDTLKLGKKFYWSFGDGSPNVITTVSNTSHTFNTEGTFTVMLIAEDSATCNVRDTSYVTIKVGINKAVLDFIPLKLLPCNSLAMQFTNTSIPAKGSFGPTSFIWDYGDGSPREFAPVDPPRVHTYASAGTYIVTLYLSDTSFCNSPDSIQKTIRISPSVKALFVTPALGCAPYQAVFENTSLAGTEFIWDFGDGATSTEITPTHLYTSPGTYIVRLIAKDTNTCNKIDTSAIFTVTVLTKPIASFSWGPNPPEENVPVRFTNQSTSATRFLWNFGDGESSTEINPTHLYNETNTYRAELIAYNEASCSDTFRLDVSTLILPLLDVPNAFTPGRFGINSIVKVAGFGIDKMDWKIYNRWGQLVFETIDRKQGWDGTFKGKLQPMDVYAYTLDVEFTDGKKLRKTGDITLLK